MWTGSLQTSNKNHGNYLCVDDCMAGESLIVSGTFYDFDWKWTQFTSHLYFQTGLTIISDRNLLHS